MKIKVGTRGSALALAQTRFVIERLEKAYPQDTFEIVVIRTTGDREQKKALDQIGSKGIFTTEIEQALMAGEIQMAVHSMKDMPGEIAEGLTFAKAWKREDPRDVLILREAASLAELPRGAVIATGSKRRQYQLQALRPDLRFVGIRGNVDTRIKRLHSGLDDGTPIDGIVLAAAGLIRLGREKEITEYLSPEEMIPAPCQGILALELRADNLGLKEKLDALSDEQTSRQQTVEREFLAACGGDCHLPIGAYLDADGGLLYTLLGNEDGSILNRKKEKYDR